MQIPVSEAKGQLSDLVRRAEAGDDIILTRHGHAAVRLVPVKMPIERTSRSRLIATICAAAAARALPGPVAARSQDFLYGDEGLPG